MSVTNVWVGAVTSTSARVVGVVVAASSRLAVSTAADLSGPVFFGPVTPTAEGVAAFTATGLAANTRYWFALETDGVLDTLSNGQFRTHPVVGSQASFTVGLGGDAGLSPVEPGVAGAAPTRLSNHAVFDTARVRAISEDWLFMAHLGDMSYYDLGSGQHGLSGAATAAQYQSMWNDVLLQPAQHRLYRNVPLVYTWDDHDFGPNDSDSTSPGRNNACTVYREKLPHYPLAMSTGANPIHHSFQVGRVLFVVSDTRADRTPNSDPDGPAKTMLGADQKAWLRQTLETSQASALVWLMPTPWMGTAADNWEGFATERNELTQMLIDLGWADRMCMITGDTHALALETGAGGNAGFGGFPVMMVGSFDATPFTPTGGFNLGHSSSRNQYGTLQVADEGATISITLTGYTGNAVWQSHVFEVAADPGGGGGEPGVPAEPVGEARTSVTWLACDLVTGGIIRELPGMYGQVSRVLGAYTSTSLQVPIPLAGPLSMPEAEWDTATIPGQTMLVPVVNDVPAAAFIVLTRKGGSGGAVLEFGCVSLEGYLDRRYVLDHEFKQVDQAAIATALVKDAAAQGIGLVIDAPASNVFRDRTYFDKDDATIYSRLRELAGVIGGIEWTIDPVWGNAERTTVAKVIRIRNRIGLATPTPNAVFSTVGDANAAYEYTEDFSDGKGANHIIATSSGEGESRPESVPAADVRSGWARYERRFTPSTSITTLSVLDEHAVNDLAQRRDGARILTIATRWGGYPRLNVDWRLGDDVGYELTSHRHPNGLIGVDRVIGWTLDIQAGVVEPILLQSSDEGEVA